MKKETKTFPLENLISIEIDRENGLAVACYEEEKPLYTNSYGREYYDGDKYTCFVLYSKFREDPIENLFNESNFDDGKLIADFIGTKKECYQYLADNCEE